MNLLLSTNLYFLEILDKWHPFVSRLYFGLLLLIQTLRAQSSIQVGHCQTKRFIDELMKEIPPASLPIPGPLVTILKSLSVNESSNTRFGPISPYLPTRIGPNQATTLYLGNIRSSYELEFPNIPEILFFTNSIIKQNKMRYLIIQIPQPSTTR